MPFASVYRPVSPVVMWLMDKDGNMGKNAKRRANRRGRTSSAKREDPPLSKNARKTDWEETEKRLESQYVAFFKESMNMPEEIAREIFKAFAEEHKEAALREGTDRLPESFGDILLDRNKICFLSTLRMCLATLLYIGISLVSSNVA